MKIIVSHAESHANKGTNIQYYERDTLAPTTSFCLRVRNSQTMFTEFVQLRAYCLLFGQGPTAVPTHWLALATGSLAVVSEPRQSSVLIEAQRHSKITFLSMTNVRT